MPRHELFLTAIIASDDVEESLKVLQGYCEMAPVNIITHNVFWEGPRARKPKAVDPNFIKQQTPPKDALWKLLSDQLSRQSYILTTSYEVEKEEFGKVDDAQVEESKGSELEALDRRPGILRWVEIPDAAGARPVNSRPLVNINDQTNLCAIMKSMNHKFLRENIQETNRFVHGNVVFELVRYALLPTPADENNPTITTKLPAIKELTLYDNAEKWVMTAYVRVSNGNDPELMQRGIDELMEAKKELAGNFPLKIMDRHIWDTRVKG